MLASLIATLLLAEPHASVTEQLRRTEGLETPAPPIDVAPCTQCHLKQTEQWLQSRHSISATNELFVDGFQAEGAQRRCLSCHAPGAELLSEPITKAGVSCVHCHSVGPGHRLVDRDSLRSAEFCAACHQFHFDMPTASKVVLASSLAQSTFDEWSEYRAGGGTETCQGCHMPGGDHRMLGGHDPDVLRTGLEVRREKNGVVLHSSNVGHYFPTGDVFRALVITAFDQSGRTLQVIRLKREFRFGRGIRTLTRDTRLRPFETRFVKLPETATVVEVRYEFAPGVSTLVWTDAEQQRGRKN